MDKQKAIISNPDVLGGEPVFSGTRVALRSLLDYLEGGENLDAFLDDYPTVSRSQAIAALEEAKDALSNEIAA